MKTLKAFAISILVSATAQAADTYTNPVMYSQWGSPNITAFRDSNGHIYGAIYQRWGRYSSNLVDWQDAYNTYDGAEWYGNGGYSAITPSISKIDNKYVMYYGIGYEQLLDPNCIAIGCCVSAEPQGYYARNKEVCTASELGLKAVNFPFMMQDPTSGKKLLFVSSPDMGIYAVTLSDDGYSLKYPIEKVQITSAEMQSPRITYHDGYYYLFAQGTQVNAWSNGKPMKTIVVGRSQNLTGPYVNARGDRMLDGYYHTAFSGNPYFDNPCDFSPLITDDEGTQWIVYGAYPTVLENHSEMIMLDRVTWLDGWPMISDGTPSYYPVKAPVIR